AKLLKHQTAPPPPLEQFRKDVPPAVAEIVRKMLAKRLPDRYQVPGAVAQALAPFAAARKKSGVKTGDGSAAISQSGDRIRVPASISQSSDKIPVPKVISSQQRDKGGSSNLLARSRGKRGLPKLLLVGGAVAVVMLVGCLGLVAFVFLGGDSQGTGAR